MKRFVLLLAVVSGCSPIERTVRTERGPLMRSFSREQVMPGGLRGQVRVAWPALEVSVVEHDVCRTLAIDEYLEEQVTERSSPAAGPSLSTGIAATLGSGVAFGFSFLASASPDMSVIDTTGRYGPSPRTMVQGGALVALLVGVPALIVGAVGFLRTGEDVEQRKVEQETGQRDVECHQRGASGSIRLAGRTGDVGAVPLAQGEGRVDASKVTGVVDELVIGDREVALDEAGVLTLSAFNACVALEAEGARAPESLVAGALVSRIERLRACRQVRADAWEAPLKALEQEAERRRASGEPGAFAPGPSVASFEDAFAAYAPRLTFKAGSADLAQLDAPDVINGQAVLLIGVVNGALAQNIGVIQIGEREVFVFIPPKRSWGGDFPNGSRVEAVAVMAGWQSVGERTLPLARLVWMRPSY